MNGVLYPFQFTSSLLASILRLGAGSAGNETNADKLPILYEFEGCPFCRVAREAVSEAGLTVLVRPSPKGGERFRPQVRELGGKEQFPYFFDPNTDKAMYESDDIAHYIAKTYGGGSLLRFLGPLNGVVSQFSTFARLASGTFVSKSTAPEKPLEFEGAERDPRARLVKERLCSLELEYIWRPRAGTPRLTDANTGDSIKGAFAIRRYLKSVYAA